MSKSLSGAWSWSTAAPASRVRRHSDRPSPAGATGLSRRLILGLIMSLRLPGSAMRAVARFHALARGRGPALRERGRGDGRYRSPEPEAGEAPERLPPLSSPERLPRLELLERSSPQP